MENDKIISFQHERTLRIEQACRTRDQLWQRLLDFADESLNLRDKVRAKHLFCQRLNLEPKILLEPFWQVHMMAWLALEYRNIRNERAIDLFLKKSRNGLSENEWIILGQFMATYLSIYEVSVHDEEVRMTDMFSQEEYLISTSGIEDTACLFSWIRDVGDKPSLMVGRLLRLGPAYGMLEPCHLVKHVCWDIERRIRSEYQQYIKENPIASWRSFMHQSGISILTGCIGSYTNTDHSRLKWRRKND
jgi:hypothetical protein